jgi:hypothetical protein
MAKTLGIALLVAIGFTISQILSARKQSTDLLRLSPAGAKGPKGINVPIEQLREVQLLPAVLPSY